jgi:hypothetical protein
VYFLCAAVSAMRQTWAVFHCERAARGGSSRRCRRRAVASAGGGGGGEGGGIIWRGDWDSVGSIGHGGDVVESVDCSVQDDSGIAGKRWRASECHTGHMQLNRIGSLRCSWCHSAVRRCDVMACRRRVVITQRPPHPRCSARLTCCHGDGITASTPRCGCVREANTKQSSRSSSGFILSSRALSCFLISSLYRLLRWRPL